MTAKTENQPAEACHPGVIDGRQSPAALSIARGTQRLLAALGMSSMSEVSLPSGRRADLVALSEKGEIWIIEIKSSVEDFRSDHKWHEYAEFCDCFFFAVDADFPSDLIPSTAGLILADRYGGEILRTNDAGKLPAARRKALTLRFARIAGARLHTLADPEAGIDLPSRV